jgi:hypothetical protein
VVEAVEFLFDSGGTDAEIMDVFAPRLPAALHELPAVLIFQNSSIKKGVFVLYVLSGRKARFFLRTALNGQGESGGR